MRVETTSRSFALALRREGLDPHDRKRLGRTMHLLKLTSFKRKQSATFCAFEQVSAETISMQVYFQMILVVTIRAVHKSLLLR